MVTQKTFFAQAHDGRLTGIRCAGCRTLAIPPKAFCDHCGKREWETVPLSGEGTVDSFTVIRVAPRKFTDEAPYAIAHVQLAEGVALLGRLVGVPLDRIAIGMRVRFRPRALKNQSALAFEAV